jgi:hypothetical protein
MLISTNSIGNYAPRIQPKAASTLPQIDEAGKTFEKINNDEKQFFAELYPEQKTEIFDYHFYQRSGKMAGVSVGSNIDRRG